MLFSEKINPFNQGPRTLLTDRQDYCGNTALCIIVHRAVNIVTQMSHGSNVFHRLPTVLPVSCINCIWSTPVCSWVQLNRSPWASNLNLKLNLNLNCHMSGAEHHYNEWQFSHESYPKKSSEYRNSLWYPELFEVDTPKCIEIFPKCFISIHNFKAQQTAVSHLGVRRYLDSTTVCTVDISVVHYKLDYCNSLYCNLLKFQIICLQQIQSSLARAAVKASKSCQVTLMSRSLHWLKITKRIEYKLLSLAYKVLTITQPPYLHNLISVQPPRSTVLCALSVRPSLSAHLSPCAGCYKLPAGDIVRWSCSSSAIVPPK